GQVLSRGGPLAQVTPPGGEAVPPGLDLELVHPRSPRDEAPDPAPRAVHAVRQRGDVPRRGADRPPADAPGEQAVAVADQGHRHRHRVPGDAAGGETAGGDRRQVPEHDPPQRRGHRRRTAMSKRPVAHGRSWVVTQIPLIDRTRTPSTVGRPSTMNERSTPDAGSVIVMRPDTDVPPSVIRSTSITVSPSTSRALSRPGSPSSPVTSPCTVGSSRNEWLNSIGPRRSMSRYTSCTSGRCTGATVVAVGPERTRPESGLRNSTGPSQETRPASLRQSAEVTQRPSEVQPRADTPKVAVSGVSGGVMSIARPPLDEISISREQLRPPP